MKVELSKEDSGAVSSCFVLHSNKKPQIPPNAKKQGINFRHCWKA